MCSSFASLADVLEWRERQRVIPAHERIWGPVSEVEAAKVGCIRAAASVVIMCAIAPSVLNGAVQCIPVELLPRADDTAEELAARLGESTFLDNAHVLNGGNGKRPRKATQLGGQERQLPRVLVPMPRGTDVLSHWNDTTERLKRVKQQTIVSIAEIVCPNF